ncbi:MAG: hypothetical protein IKP20_07980 [Candidatus Methanomethylophilaceae archaeon]|nr:hypothetical protein [Candidatus Methanomethylophilaceae archaeon]
MVATESGGLGTEKIDSGRMAFEESDALSKVRDALGVMGCDQYSYNESDRCINFIAESEGKIVHAQAYVDGEALAFICGPAKLRIPRSCGFKARKAISDMNNAGDLLGRYVMVPIDAESSMVAEIYAIPWKKFDISAEELSSVMGIIMDSVFESWDDLSLLAEDPGATALDTVKDAMKLLDVDYSVKKDIVMFGLQGDDMQMFVGVYVSDGCLTIRIKSAIVVSANRKATALESLDAINSSMRMGAFCLTKVKKGYSIGYRYTLPLMGIDLTPEIVAILVKTSIAAVDSRDGDLLALVGKNSARFSDFMFG